jgi:hypothetical protein
MASSSGATGALSSFTPSPGSGVTIGAESTAGIDGLAFNSLGTLYALGQGTGSRSPVTSALYTANQTTGALTLVGPTGVLAGFVGGLTFDLSGAILYAAIDDDPVRGLEAVASFSSPSRLPPPRSESRLRS